MAEEKKPNPFRKLAREIYLATAELEAVMHSNVTDELAKEITAEQQGLLHTVQSRLRRACESANEALDLVDLNREFGDD